MTNAVLKPLPLDLSTPAHTLLHLAVTPNDLYRFAQDLVVLQGHPVRPYGTEAVVLTQRVRAAALLHGRLVFAEGPVSITAAEQQGALEAALAAPLHTSAGVLTGPEDRLGLGMTDDLRDALRVRVAQVDRLRAAVLELAAANDAQGRAERQMESQVAWAGVKVILGMGILLTAAVLTATLVSAVVCVVLALVWLAGVFLTWKGAERRRQRARRRQREALGALERAARTVEVGMPPLAP